MNTGICVDENMGWNDTPLIYRQSVSAFSFENKQNIEPIMVWIFYKPKPRHGILGGSIILLECTAFAIDHGIISAGCARYERHRRVYFTANGLAWMAK